MAKIPVKTDIAARLKAARLKVFNTAVDAAEAIGMNPVTLRAHENAQNGVSIYDLERYARRYGTSLVYLMTGEGDEQPDLKQHFEAGVFVDILGTIDETKWMPEDEAPLWADGDTPQLPDGLFEAVVFTDPRFPEDIVRAWRVRTSDPKAFYPDNTIVFCVPVTWIRFGEGDHVIVLRERGEFVNLSIRRIDSDPEQQRVYSSLTSDSPAIRTSATDKEAEPYVMDVIIGSLTRRDVNPLTPEQRRAYEDEAKVSRNHRLGRRHNKS